MDSPETEDEQTGMNRRDLLRRGAILGGALAWTVPAVQTLSGAAFAAGSPCIGRFEYRDTRGNCFFVQYNPSNTCCDCITTTTAALGGPQFIVIAGAICQLTAQCTVASSGTC